MKFKILLSLICAVCLMATATVAYGFNPDVGNSPPKTEKKVSKASKNLSGISLIASHPDPDVGYTGISSNEQPSCTIDTPLILVDDIPYTGSIYSIDHKLVESITILKDQAATLKYGARGAKGVIVIKMKKKDTVESVNKPIILFAISPALNDHQKIIWNYAIKKRDKDRRGRATNEYFRSQRSSYSPGTWRDLHRLS